MLLHLALFLGDKLVDFENEISDFVKVVACKLFNVIVACTVDVVGRVFVFAGLVELYCVVKRNDFVTAAVNDEDWTVYLRHPVNVREAVKWQSPSQVEDNSQGRHQRGVQYNTCYWVLLSKKTRRS